MKRLIPVLLTVVVIFTAFTSIKKEPITNAKWLLAKWENVSPAGTLVEAWTKQDDSTYTGYSYLLAGTDTIFSEHIRLEQRKGDLYYVPVVKGQNDGKGVVFKASLHNKKQLVFENPLHDFPQKVTYAHPTKDSLVAEISGLDKGVFKSEKFLMVRSK